MFPQWLTVIRRGTKDLLCAVESVHIQADVSIRCSGTMQRESDFTRGGARLPSRAAEGDCSGSLAAAARAFRRNYGLIQWLSKEG
jgi:hypothetical protein